MLTIPRILRNTASDADRAPRHLTPREEARRDRIRHLGLVLMARHGRHTISLGNFAIALGYCTATVRRQFADMDALLAEILRDHLLQVSRCLGEIPRDAPDRQARLRSAYLAATRTFGAFTEAHLLLTRDCHLLPDDERESIDLIRQGLAHLFEGGPRTLALLDMPSLSAEEIEIMVLACEPRAQTTKTGWDEAIPPRPPGLGLVRRVRRPPPLRMTGGGGEMAHLPRP